MHGADHIVSTLKRCCSNARGILKIVNILEDFKNASLQNTKYFNYSQFQVIKYILLEMVKLIKLKKLKKFMSYLTVFASPPPPPPPLRPQHYGIISICHRCMVWIEKSVTRVTDRHHEACRVMPNSDPE